MAAIEVSDLVVRYGDRLAVDRLSFRACAGEVVALLGPNGAGKTTTVETLEGYRRPTEGAVRVLGLDPAGDRTRVTPDVGVMLQRGGVYPAMSAIDALRLFASRSPSPWWAGRWWRSWTNRPPASTPPGAWPSAG